MLRALQLERRELSVLLTDDGFIRELNHAHRGKDRPTDVLAFPLDEGVEEGEPAGPIPGKSRKNPARGAGARKARHRQSLDLGASDALLGDVIISLDTAARQARQRRHSLLDEVCFLLAHGLLHLIGYDHHTDAEEREMNELTSQLVSAATTARGASEPKKRHGARGGSAETQRAVRRTKTRA
jgi:probable rRNA maturation factor